MGGFIICTQQKLFGLSNPKNEMGGVYDTRRGEGTNNAYRVMVRIYKQYTLLAKPRRGWDDNMKMVFTKNSMGRH
jgi:hypothetical protein